MRQAIVITCEHASKRVPRRLAARFTGAADALASHRGHDIGALPVARYLADALGAPLFVGRASRLVVDLNRSAKNPEVFSEFTRDLEPSERAELIASYHAPYRAQVQAAIESQVDAGARVLHISVHSFTPSLGSQVRRADIGLLYDPGRTWERSLAGAWHDALEDLDPELVVRRNYPYRGVTDGFTRTLRQRFADARYAGIEVECNQRLVRTPGTRKRLARLIEETVPRSP